MSVIFDRRRVRHFRRPRGLLSGAGVQRTVEIIGKNWVRSANLQLMRVMPSFTPHAFAIWGADQDSLPSGHKLKSRKAHGVGLANANDYRVRQPLYGCLWVLQLIAHRVHLKPS
jgi:hypothetical protein